MKKKRVAKIDGSEIIVPQGLTGRQYINAKKEAYRYGISVNTYLKLIKRDKILNV